jgi:hypothetical protein
MVFNPTETMDADQIEATLLQPDGQMEELLPSSKTAFAARLIERAAMLVGRR